MRRDYGFGIETLHFDGLQPLLSCVVIPDYEPTPHLSSPTARLEGIKGFVSSAVIPEPTPPRQPKPEPEPDYVSLTNQGQYRHSTNPNYYNPTLGRQLAHIGGHDANTPGPYRGSRCQPADSRTPLPPGLPSGGVGAVARVKVKVKVRGMGRGRGTDRVRVSVPCIYCFA